MNEYLGTLRRPPLALGIARLPCNGAEHETELRYTRDAGGATGAVACVCLVCSRVSEVPLAVAGAVLLDRRVMAA